MYLFSISSIPTWLIVSFTFIIALCIGSFWNVLLYRIPRDIPGSISGHSSCPYCQHRLTFFDLIPLLSFVLRKGKCHYCNKKISWKYPLVEFTTGIICVSLSTLIFSPSIFDRIFLFGIGSILTLLLFFDSWYLILPKQILVLLCSWTILGKILQFFFFHGSQNSMLFFQDSIIGAISIGIFFALQYFLSHKKAIGEGDIYLGICLGILFGWKLGIVAIFLSYILASFFALFILVSQKGTLKSKLPLGSFLCIGSFITLLWGKNILNWYLGMIGLH